MNRGMSLSVWFVFRSLALLPFGNVLIVERTSPIETLARNTVLENQECIHLLALKQNKTASATADAPMSKCFSHRIIQTQTIDLAEAQWMILKLYDKLCYSCITKLKNIIRNTPEVSSLPVRLDKEQSEEHNSFTVKGDGIPMKIESFGGFVHNEAVPRPVRSTQGNEQAKAIFERYKDASKWQPGTSLFMTVSNFAKYERNGLQVRLQKFGMKVTVHLDPAGKFETVGKGDDAKELFTGKVFIRRMSDAEWKKYQEE